MINDEENIKTFGKKYEELTNYTKVHLICDYCGQNFTRNKKQVKTGLKTSSKQACKKCVGKRRGDTCEAKYGVRCYIKHKDFQAKKEKTCEILYGHADPSQSEFVKKKREKTLKNLYGVSNASQMEGNWEKCVETNKRKYNAEHYSQTQECRDRVKKTSIEKFGEEHYAKTQECKERVANTNENKFGYKYLSQVPEVKEKIKEVCLEKYGVENVFQAEEIKQLIVKNNKEKYGVSHPMQNEIFKTNVIENIIKKYGKFPVNCYGKAQGDLQNWLNSFKFNFKTGCRILKGKQVDLYDEILKLGIEYCGLYWHNELSPQSRDKEYHHKKYEDCLSKGIRLITIFEDEWSQRQQQCKNFLLHTIGHHDRKIHARKCKIKEITKKEANTFYEGQHIQGGCNLSLVNYGLFFEDELVGVMSLGRHHRQKQKYILLNRLCFKGGCHVIGGATKLFVKCKEWAKQNNHERIVSFSDNRWSQGHIYKVMGFKLDEELGPDYSYVSFKQTTERFSKQSQQKSKTGCPKDVAEREWALRHGLARIWDCGKKRWVYEL